VKRVLFVISSLDYGGAARQLMLLAAGLPRERFEVRVCVLGGAAPWGQELSAAGVVVETLGRTRSFDVQPLLALRRLLGTFRADVVHVWGAASLRATALFQPFRALWVSAVLPPVGDVGHIDRWLMRRAARVVAIGETEAARYRAIGVAVERMAVIPPAAQTMPEDALGHDALLANVVERAIVVLGPLARHKGVRDALWAMDVLHYLYPDLELVLVGERPASREIDGLAHVERVHFVGPRTSATPFLERAEVVWVPGRAGGVHAALEAMAAGKPVVAGRSAELAEVIEEGVTGAFVRPGDKADLARQTRRLLDDPERRRIMGEAGRRRAAERFGVEEMVGRYVGLLDG
jgi:glycosyltransferase involved in cell wall biosynthesis